MQALWPGRPRCRGRPASHVRLRPSGPSLHRPAPRHLPPLTTWFPCCPALLRQAGIVPEVLPELAKGAAAPFGLTSFALSTLLVLR